MFYQWLIDVEDVLVRMIAGVFRFMVDGLPTWIYHFVVDTLGPVAIRLVRVLGLAFLWLTILFGPLAIGCFFSLPSWWGLGSMAWMALSIGGSVWGLNRIVRKRKAAIA